MPFPWNTAEAPYSFLYEWTDEDYFLRVREFSHKYKNKLVALGWGHDFAGKPAEWQKASRNSHGKLRAELDQFIKLMRSRRVPEAYCMLAIMAITSPKLSNDLQYARDTSKSTELMSYLNEVAFEIYSTGQTQKFLDFLTATADRPVNSGEQLVNNITRFEHLFLLKALADFQSKHAEKFRLYDLAIKLYGSSYISAGQPAEAQMLLEMLIARYRTKPYDLGIDVLLQSIMFDLIHKHDNSVSILVEEVYKQIGWEQSLPVRYPVIGLKKNITKPELSTFTFTHPEPCYCVESVPNGTQLVLGVDLNNTGQETLFACHGHLTKFLDRYYAHAKKTWYIATPEDLVLKKPAEPTPSVAAPAPTTTNTAPLGTQNDNASEADNDAAAERTLDRLTNIVVAAPAPHLSMYERARNTAREAYRNNQRAINGGAAAVVAAAAVVTYSMS
jgi:hypothetical protein